MLGDGKTTSFVPICCFAPERIICMMSKAVNNLFLLYTLRMIIAEILFVLLPLTQTYKLVVSRLQTILYVCIRSKIPFKILALKVSQLTQKSSWKNIHSTSMDGKIPRFFDSIICGCQEEVRSTLFVATRNNLMCTVCHWKPTKQLCKLGLTSSMYFFVLFAFSMYDAFFGECENCYFWTAAAIYSPSHCCT